MDFRKAVSITTEEFDSNLVNRNRRERKDRITYPRFNEVLMMMELGDAIRYPCSWEHKGSHCMGTTHVGSNASRIRRKQVNSTAFSSFCHEGNFYVKSTA